MRKEFITALATVLTSTMVTIPVQAARADWDTGGYTPDRPADHRQWEEEYTQFVNPEEAGAVETDAVIMEAFGGREKYYASYEQVSSEYFKQKYAEAASLLKDKVDSTDTNTVITTALNAVNAHFTSRWSSLGYVGYYSFDQRMYTDYLSTGRYFSGYEPAVLYQTILNSHSVGNSLHRMLDNDYAYCVIVQDTGKTYYVIFGDVAAQITTTAPDNLNQERLADMYMGAYKDFVN